MFDAAYYSRQAVYDRLVLEAQEIHGDRFEFGHELRKVDGAYRVVPYTDGFSVAAVGPDGGEHFFTARLSRENLATINVKVPKALLEEGSLAPNAAKPGTYVWTLSKKDWNRGAHRIAVRDDMNDEHIALNFKNFDLAMEILMHTVMAHATGKHSPAV